MMRGNAIEEGRHKTGKKKLKKTKISSKKQKQKQKQPEKTINTHKIALGSQKQ